MSFTRPMRSASLCILMHPIHAREVALMLTALEAMSVEDREQTIILMRWSAEHCMVGQWAQPPDIYKAPYLQYKEPIEQAHILGKAV